MNLEKQYACHGGTVSYYTHISSQTKTMMRFSLFLPPGVDDKKDTPYIIFLSGLTCSADNFTTKAGAFERAATLGLAILAPDTSPRGEDVPDDKDYALGQGAGFYVDANQEPWCENFQMESYVIEELLPLVESTFTLDQNAKSIMGHSMGGHGALSLYFRHPNVFSSCSAFAPIVAPSQVPWGQNAFKHYFGNDDSHWQSHDACALLESMDDADKNAEILIDQGLSDEFMAQQLKPHLFEDACKAQGQKLTLRYHEHYDHSYFFIQSFVADHLEWHAKYLGLA